jgi:hypothetical protein
MVTIDSNLHRFAQMRPEAMIERSWPRWFTRLPACHGSPGGITRRCAPRPSGHPTCRFQWSLSNPSAIDVQFALCCEFHQLMSNPNL